MSVCAPWDLDLPTESTNKSEDTIDSGFGDNYTYNNNNNNNKNNNDNCKYSNNKNKNNDNRQNFFAICRSNDVAKDKNIKSEIFEIAVIKVMKVKIKNIKK